MMRPSQATFNQFELGAPLYAPHFFNTANPPSYMSLNDFGAETDCDVDDEANHGYDSYEVPALSTPGATGAHVPVVASGEGCSGAPLARAMDEEPDQLTRCQKKNIKKRAKRLESRKRVQEATGTSLKACSLKHRSAAIASKLTPQHNLDELEDSKLLSLPAWIAKKDEQDWVVYGFEEVVDSFGMTLIDWDGRYAYRLTI